MPTPLRRTTESVVYAGADSDFFVVMAFAEVAAGKGRPDRLTAPWGPLEGGERSELRG